ncbi:MAG: MATE family efflux transporter [Planctomycetota bacterium]|nr:MATE family efflux transporter [Planctomycetota bacterium]
MRNTTKEPIAWAIASLSLPACLSFLLQNAYHVNDAYFLGQVGRDSMNGLGLFMMVSIANFGFILTLARGTQSLLARRLGADNPEGAFKALAQGLSLALRVVVPLVVLEWIFLPQILAFMGGEGATVDRATAYLQVIFLFMPFLFAGPILEFAFQGLGDTKTPMRLQIMAVSLNTLLNWALVLPHLVVLPFIGEVGFGGYGVVGAAVATGCSRFASSTIGFLIMARRYGDRGLLDPANYGIDVRAVREILRVGIPAGTSTLLFALVSMKVMEVMGGVGGQDAYGAYGIGFRGVESISFMLVLGIGVGTSTVAAHAVGAGLMDRARRAGHVGVGLGSIVMLATGTLMYLYPRQLAGLYTGEEAILAIAGTYIATMAFCQVPQAVEMIYADAMAGAGSSARTAAITIPGNLLRWPVAWYLASVQGWGLRGVWYAILGSCLIKAVGVAALFLSGRWVKAAEHGRLFVGGAQGEDLPNGATRQ